MASKPSPKWVGDKKLTETPNSPQIEDTFEGVSITRIYEGPYDVCQAQRPKKGTKLKTEGEYTFVFSTKVDRLEGGRGRLTVNSKQRLGTKKEDTPPPEEEDPEQSEDNPVQSKEPVVEIEWTRVDRPLATHKVFKDLSNDDWYAIKSWEALEKDDPEHYANFQYMEPEGGTWMVLPDLALKYATKRRMGVDSWMAFFPVVTVTDAYPNMPRTGRCGKKGSPAGGFAPGGYEYVKTADRAVRQNGEWARVRQWTGASEWDDDLYGAEA